MYLKLTKRKDLSLADLLPRVEEPTRDTNRCSVSGKPPVLGEQFILCDLHVFLLNLAKGFVY